MDERHHSQTPVVVNWIRRPFKQTCLRTRAEPDLTGVSQEEFALASQASDVRASGSCRFTSRGGHYPAKWSPLQSTPFRELTGTTQFNDRRVRAGTVAAVSKVKLD